MAHAANVHLFADRLNELVDTACQQTAKLGVERTVLSVLSNDVKLLVDGLASKFPIRDSSLDDLPDEVVALQHRCKDLHEANVKLRCDSELREQRVSDLVKRLALRDNVMENLRKQAAMTLVPSRMPAASVELVSAMEMENIFVQARAEEAVQKSEAMFRRELERQRSSLQKIIDAKEKEIIQLQLHFRNTLSGVQVFHAANLHELGQRFDSVSKELASANQTATIRAEEEFSVKWKAELAKVKQEHSEAICLMTQEIGSLTEGTNLRDMQLRLLEKMNSEVNQRLKYSQHALQHVLTIEIPYLAQLNSQRVKNTAATSAEEKEKDSEKIAELLHLQRHQEAKAAQELAALNARVTVLARDLAAKDAHLKESEASNKKLSIALSKAESQVAELRSQLESAKQKANANETTQLQWMEKMQSVKNEKDELIASLRIELLDAQREIAATEMQLCKCRSDLAATQLLVPPPMEIAEHEAQTDDQSQKMKEDAEQIVSLHRQISILTEELLSARAEKNLQEKKYQSALGFRSPSTVQTPDEVLTEQRDMLPADMRLSESISPFEDDSATAIERAQAAALMARKPTVVGPFPVTSTGGTTSHHLPRRTASISERQHRVATATSESQTDDVKIVAAGVRETPGVASMPKNVDCFVQCTLSSDPETRHGEQVQPSAPSGREMASLEERKTNAMLRVELVELRMRIQNDDDAEILPPSMELQPIPLSYTEDVAEQNLEFTHEVDRRHMVCDTHIFAQRHSTKDGGVAVIQPAAEVENPDSTLRLNIINIPATSSQHHETGAATTEAADVMQPFITAVTPHHLSDEQAKLQSMIHLRAHQQVRELQPQPPSTARDTVSIVDYHKQLVRLPFSNLMPISAMKVDAHGREMPATPHGSGFRRRPQSARPASRSSHRTTLSRPESRGPAQLSDFVDPTHYFNVTAMMSSGKKVGAQMAAASDPTEQPTTMPVAAAASATARSAANLVVSAYVPFRSHHSGYADPPARTLGEVMRKRAAVQEQWPSRPGTIHPIRRMNRNATDVESE